MNKEKSVLDLVESLNPKLQLKTIGVIKILGEMGTSLREPYSKKISDHLYELRIRQGTDIVRILYFYCSDNRAVLTNGFIKKSNKTPVREISKAEKYRADYLKRGKDDEI